MMTPSPTNLRLCYLPIGKSHPRNLTEQPCRFLPRVPDISCRGNSPMAMNGNSPVVRKTGEQDALQKIVMHAFSLRPAFRRVFLLCDIQGFTVARTAAILGISNAAVRMR